MSDARADARAASGAAANNDRAFLVGLGAVYAALVALLTLTISPYFALGWDVTTFIGAGWSLLDWSDPFSLYVRSRAETYWPYAYPPLHAAFIALFLPLHSLIPLIPESLLARAPVVCFDIAMAWFLHRQVGMAARSLPAARLAAALWLFNPVTLYQTAVQAHFESEWVLLVLVAYALASGSGGSRETGGRRLAAATVCLALAILVKQVALILAIPFWLHLWLRGRRWEMVASGLSTAGLVALACLPFALRSPDFLYMVTGYVAEMPVQTQSAVVWLLAFQDRLTSPVTTDIWLVRYATPIIAAAAGLVSLAALRRGHDLYSTGLLVALVFFLLSPKVMAYYYAIVLPFAIIVLLRDARSRLLSSVLATLAYIMLSPYFASWVEPAHLPVYAALGTANTLFYAWLVRRVWIGAPRRLERSVSWTSGEAGGLAGLLLGLGLALAVPTLAQPLHPLLAAGSIHPAAQWALCGLLLALSLAAIWPVSMACSRWFGGCSRPAAVVSLALYWPFTFLQFYATIESTRILEWFLSGSLRI